MGAKITYENLLSSKKEDFCKKLYSQPVDYDGINLIELIKKARDKGLNKIHFLRMDFYQKDIQLLDDLGVYCDLDMGSTWFYDLFLNKEDFDNHLKRKEELFVECISSFVRMGLI